MSFICFVLGAIILGLLAVKVDLGDKLRWDYAGLFLLALGLALAYLPPLSWPVVRRPQP